MNILNLLKDSRLGDRVLSEGFTLVEILVSLSIFMVVMSLVVVSLVQTFRSFSLGEKISAREQRQRICLFKMSKDFSSLVKVDSSKKSFKATGDSFFFVFAKEASLSESRYLCNKENQTLDHYYQQFADYDETTYETKETLLDGLSECGFSYYYNSTNGTGWKTEWTDNQDGPPQMIKMNFKYKEDSLGKEFIVCVPVSQ